MYTYLIYALGSFKSIMHHVPVGFKYLKVVYFMITPQLGAFKFFNEFFWNNYVKFLLFANTYKLNSWEVNEYNNKEDPLEPLHPKQKKPTAKRRIPHPDEMKIENIVTNSSKPKYFLQMQYS